MFGPLLFPSGSSSSAGDDPSSSSVHFDPTEQKFGPCLLCSKVYRFPNDAQDCLSHIFHDHKLVIGDVHQIVDLPEYLRFWKKKLTQENLSEFCSKMKVDVKKSGEVMKDQEYYLLSDVVNDDKEIRKKLQDDKIQSALDQQKKERDDSNYSHGCLFCRQDIGPTREEYLNHLSSQHNVQLGRPANLVYVDKLITIIEEKMENLQCIYCEKYFKDRNVLKEHMRKKGHKRVNPNNELYDQFYIVNYLEAGKKWKEMNKRLKRDASPVDDQDDDEGSDWSDWEDECKVSIACLFCERSDESWPTLLSHMTQEHSFDYQRNAKGMDFYHQVKTINYIRRQVFKNRCIICDEEKEDRGKLLDHMKSESHFKMPGSELWDKPEYFFPTYENDAFLSQIDDNTNDDDDNEELEEVLTEIENSRNSSSETAPS